jgi:putative membrane-bound dehydrogenase-like protein
MNPTHRLLAIVLAASGGVTLASAAEAPRKIVLIAGNPSHGPGDHEHNAGMRLLQKCLWEIPGITVETHSGGWVESDAALDGAAAVVVYSDGAGGHPVLQGDRLERIAGLVGEGTGLGMIHFAVEVPADRGGPEFLRWIGGYFETYWSVNPFWTANFTAIPDHPATRGVKPFEIRDEWYFNMRFAPEMKGVTPLLSAIPPDDVFREERSDRGGNPDVYKTKGQPHHLAWAFERPGGGRGFGFTGGHSHTNWGHDDFRKLVLNSILWIAGAEVPANGVESVVTAEDLRQHLDDKGGPRPDPHAAVTRGKPGTKPAWQSKVVSRGMIDIDVELDQPERLWLVVTDGGDGYGCDWANWIEPRVETPDGTVKLTDLKWTLATAGFGQVRVGLNNGGNPLMTDGKAFLEGIGTHAQSVIAYDLPAGVSRFTAKGALDDGGTSQGCGSTVTFAVFTEEPPQTFASPAPAGPAGTRGSGPEAAAESAGLSILADGLEATLFASEPMLVNPTNIDVDARGRVWVTEGANYRGHQKSREGGDRIVILEDTTGDGRADLQKVFYQDPEINAALGICVLGNKVIVSASPNIIVLTDTNGDDKADTREVLFSGIGGQQHDHGVHAFVFGPDGKFYFNFGDAGRQLRDAEGKPVLDPLGREVNDRGQPYRKGMVFRCNPDGSGLEVLGHNFRNNYEVAVDSFGTLWQSDNDDDGNQGVRINYVMEYGNFGYTDERTGAGWTSERTNREEEIPYRHWYQNDPGVVPNLLHTGAGSPCGITVYEGDLLPERFHNQMIHCDNGPRVVRAYPVTKHGAGFSAEMDDIMTSSDTWFRPSDVAVAPDGSLIVADWHDPGVGGHGMGDNVMETMRGRIYRIAPAGHQSSVPTLDLDSAAGRIAALRSPNAATRFLAWTAIHAQGRHDEDALAGMWNADEATTLNAAHRARALHLLARLPDGRGDVYVNQAAADPDPDLRLTAVRVARGIGMDVIPLVSKLAADPAPEVRRECAIALRHHESPKAPALWAELAKRHDGSDRWYLEALGIGADRRDAECFDAWLGLVGDDWNTAAGRDLIWRSRAPKAATYLAKIILDPATKEEDRPRYIRALDFLDGPEKDAALIEMLGAGI